MRILFINDYPMDEAYECYKQGTYPGQHLWGTLFKSEDYRVIYFKHEKYKWLNKVGELIKIRFLDQQIRVLLNYKKFDVLYSGANRRNTFLLALLKRLGIFQKPIVVIQHPRGIVSHRFISNIIYKSYDRIITVSEKVKEEMIENIKLPAERYVELKWGMDLDYFKPVVLSTQKHDFFISTGKTGRDFEVLAKAFNDTNLPVKIFCTKQNIPTKKYKENIEFDYVTYPYTGTSQLGLLNEYNKSIAVLIPLTENPGMNGTTNFLEALAMGKPVIMTKNEYIDIDIEKEKIGFWIKTGDVEGWKRAVLYLYQHPEEARLMGKRAYELCIKNYDMNIMSGHLKEVFKSFENYQN